MTMLPPGKISDHVSSNNHLIIFIGWPKQEITRSFFVIDNFGDTISEGAAILILSANDDTAQANNNPYRTWPKPLRVDIRTAWRNVVSEVL